MHPTITDSATLRANEQHLRRIIIDARVMALVRLGMRAGAVPGYQRELIEHFLQAHDEATLAANFAFQLSAEVAPQDAVLARRLTDRPSMQDLMRASERLFIETDGRPVKTPELQRMNDALEREAGPEELQAYARVAQLFKRFDAYFGSALQAHEAALVQGFKTIMQVIGRLASSLRIDTGEIPTERLGFAPLDKTLEVFCASLHAQAALLEQAARAERDNPIEDIFEASNLTRRATIRRSRRRLAQFEQIAQIYVKAYKQILTQRAEAVRAAGRELPGFDAAHLDLRLNDTMGYLDRLMANRRRQYDTLREMLAFAEARLGQGGVEDVHLLFSTYADVAAWRGLGEDAARLDLQEQEEMAVRQEMQRRMIGIWKGRPERPRRGALRKLRLRARSPARSRLKRTPR